MTRREISQPPGRCRSWSVYRPVIGRPCPLSYLNRDSAVAVSPFTSMVGAPGSVGPVQEGCVELAQLSSVTPPTAHTDSCGYERPASAG
jgi:hypothetical protein